jgi:RecA-family ATPase
MRDENDKHRDGKLGSDPRAGDEPQAERPSSSAGAHEAAFQWLRDEWRTIGERGSWLKTKPPEPRWLLNAEDGKTGLLRLGKVGMLAAAGAVGKTHAAIQLSLAVGSGTRWLDTYPVATPGRVLLALGEEDAEEIHRRLYYAGQNLGMKPEELERAAANIVALPLAGRGVPLVTDTGYGRTERTERTTFFHELVRLLGAHEWSLLIFDPMSRFAGADAEKDNAAATRLVEAFEELAKVKGNPTVLMCHHTTKGARREDGDGQEATAARGASALTDGVRFVMTLESRRWSGKGNKPKDLPKLLDLHVPKMNHTEEPGGITLIRGSHGELRRASEAAIMQWRDAKKRAGSDTTTNGTNGTTSRLLERNENVGFEDL